MILTSYQPDFIPILRELKDLEIVALNAQFAKILNETDIPAKSLNDFVDQNDYELSRNIAALGLLEYFKCEFDGSFGDERDQWLINNLPGYFYSRLGDIALVALALYKIKPQLILLHNDVEPMNRMLALWAKENEVPCLHVPHAIYLENSGRGALGSDVHDLITATHIACSGPQQAEWYGKRGANPDHLYLTGLPKTDKGAAYKGDKAAACRLVSQDVSRPVVTYCSSWRQDTNLLGCHDGIEESYQEFLEAAKELPELQYIVKCHPRGNNVEWHKKLAKEAGVRCVVTDQHIDIVLAASDLVITYGASNVAIEAIFRPYTRVCIIGDEDAMPDDPEIVKVKQGELKDNIKKLLSENPPDYSRLLRKYYYSLDGKSYLRIAKLARMLHG